MKNNSTNTTEAKEIKDELTVTRFEAEQQLEHFIGNLKIEGMSVEGKKAIIHLKLKLSEIIKQINEFKETTMKSVDKPENFDKLKEDAERSDATEEQKKQFKEAEEGYNKKLAEVLVPYYNEVVNVPFEFLSDSDFDVIIEHNNIDLVYGYEYIYNKLVRK